MHRHVACSSSLYSCMLKGGVMFLMLSGGLYNTYVQLSSMLLPLKSGVWMLYLRRSIVKAMVFPVVMYGCESSTVKKAEC